MYFTLVYTILIIVVPILLVSILNTLIIKKLLKSADQWTTAKLELHEQEMSYKEIKDRKLQIENLKITWTLFIISLTFILLTLPHMIVYFLVSNKLTRNPIVQILHRVAEILFLLNHCINFFLYVISRKSFRRVLKDKMRCSCFDARKFNSRDAYPMPPRSLFNYNWSSTKQSVANHNHANSNNDNNNNNKSASHIARQVGQSAPASEHLFVNHNHNNSNHQSRHFSAPITATNDSPCGFLSADRGDTAAAAAGGAHKPLIVPAASRNLDSVDYDYENYWSAVPPSKPSETVSSIKTNLNATATPSVPTSRSNK